MRRTVKTLAILVLVGLLGGCATGKMIPKLSHALVTPPEVNLEESVVITVAVKDRAGLVGRLDATVEGWPNAHFQLKDDGVPPDETANDGIWTMLLKVPFQAPPGEYRLYITAYTAHGVLIPVPDKKGEAVPLSVPLTIVIRAPQE